MQPSGTVSFLFTDLEESSRLWDQYPQAMQAALARHDDILRECIVTNRGVIVKGTGDGVHAVFDLPWNAIQAALDGQLALLAQPWESTGPLRVRMGIHTGQAQLREGDYYGPAVNRAARVMSVAAGEQVLLSSVTAELVRDRLLTGGTLVDLGQHRLRSLDRPERLYQLQHPDLRAEFPPLKSLRTTPNNVPLQLTNFIGREQASVELKLLLATEDDLAPSVSRPRLITLTGPGGTGKTRLSVQVAGEILQLFPDGVWLAELAPLADPQQVVRAVAEPMGLNEQPGQPLLAMLTNYLRPRKVLLIMDNCEHLLDACAAMADDLLRSCPRLTILASSREALGIAGEQAIRVRSLSLPEGETFNSAVDLIGFDAIQLFVSRAKEVKSSFALNDENATSVLSICRRLDGIPLAIELAAARVRVLSPRQILDRLDDRFRLLTGGSRTAIPRQRTLQALIDWSYELLSESERVLLRRLSVFSGGWTLKAAENVTVVGPLEPFDILDLLEQLVNKSLILAKEDDIGMRYRMLETIRQYAQEKLTQSGEAELLRDRHLAFFVEQQEQSAQDMMALRVGDWAERMLADRDNLRAARSWALGTDVKAALRFMASVTFRWSIIFPASEGVRYLSALLDLAESSPDYSGPEASAENRKLFGQVMVSAANLGLGIGHPETIAYAERGATIAREYGNQTDLVWSLVLAVARADGIGDAKGVRQYYQELSPLISKLDPGWVLATVLTTVELNFAAITGTNEEQAWQNWEIGMTMFRQAGEFWSLAWGYSMAANVSIGAGELEKAQYNAERSLSLFTEIGDTQMVNIARSQTANVARQRGDLDRASHYYNIAISGWRNVDQYGALARCLECLAFVYRDRVQTVGEEERNSWLARSATLLGAAAAIRQAQNSPMTPRERTEYEEELALIKEATGKRGFDGAWQQGQTMDPDEAVAFAGEL